MKSHRDDNDFHTYVHDQECQVQNKNVHKNLLDGTFEVDTVVDISTGTLVKKIVDDSNQDSTNVQQSQVGFRVENISLLEDENYSNYDTDSNISKFESCQSVENGSDDGSLI